MGITDVLRINEHDPRPVRLEMGDDSLRLWYGDVEVALHDISAVWYWKGSFWFDELTAAIDIAGHPTLSAKLNGKMASEDARAREYFHHLLAVHTRTLGCARPELGKLVVLSMARQLGLATPVSIVSNRRDAFVNALRHGSQLITKALSDGVYLWDFEGSASAYFSYTEQLAGGELAALPATIPLSLAQHQIDKQFEVRAFFLDGEFHCIAIFSQTDAATVVDYRKYNYEKPNRNVPYRLPREVESQLRELFARLQLNTGSVDLIVDGRGRHYFLEINPSGQYQGVSQVCNYNLDQKIAEWLAGTHGQ
jgi:ATP-GRASP peptide maturase of grasp-with-spasm system